MSSAGVRCGGSSDSSEGRGSRGDKGARQGWSAGDSNRGALRYAPRAATCYHAKPHPAPAPGRLGRRPASDAGPAAPSPRHAARNAATRCNPGRRTQRQDRAPRGRPGRPRSSLTGGMQGASAALAFRHLKSDVAGEFGQRSQTTPLCLAPLGGPFAWKECRVVQWWFSAVATRQPLKHHAVAQLLPRQALLASQCPVSNLSAVLVSS